MLVSPLPQIPGVAASGAGLNDSDEHLDWAHKLAKYADATVFTGLFYRDEIAAC
jgi:hypothetical protein